MAKLFLLASLLPFAAALPAGRPVAEDKAGQVDLVVARNNQPLEWLARVQKEALGSKASSLNTYVYDKGGKNSVKIPESLDAKVTHMVNVGMEAHSFLTHIVEHYDDLAEKTVFITGARPSVVSSEELPGRSGDSLRPESGYGLLTESGFAHDYLSPDSPSVYLPTSAVAPDESVIAYRESSGASRLAERLSPLKAATVGGKQHIPTACPAEGSWSPWLDGRGLKAAVDRMMGPGSERSSLMDFWKSHLQERLGPMPETYLLFAQGGIFSASKDMIRKHPKSFYATLMQRASRESAAETRYFEKVWGYVLGGLATSTQCDKLPAPENRRK